ncbi:MAG TPA: ATP-binding protein, partial [Gemmatimonadaceae bacterium]|nr:ATP-binding protein [Gemmatimonadaceae bacterium]
MTAEQDGSTHPTFSVDTNLFRELGELLVGRDSTALVELIKNSYDADATLVSVYGEALDDEQLGYIRISDDGTGMTSSEFRLGFLRIASRGKEVGQRRSLLFGRRFTGAKGVGRLAAHKLARIVEVTSLRWNGETNRRRPVASSGVTAIIDWDQIEKHHTLDEIAGTKAISVSELRLDSPSKPGTSVTLRKLRQRWSKAAHARFLE